MNSVIRIDRRRLIQAGLSAGILAALPVAGISCSEHTESSLLRHVGDSELPVDATRTGILNDKEFGALFRLCEFIDAGWELDVNLAAYRPLLKSDLSLKTDRQPSYLGEYRNAVNLIEELAADTGSNEQTWLTLLFAEFDDDEFEASELGRARNFVFSEIVAHMVPLSGAFKGFGMVNYRGYFGGSYTSSASYRRGGE